MPPCRRARGPPRMVVWAQTDGGALGEASLALPAAETIRAIHGRRGVAEEGRGAAKAGWLKRGNPPCISGRQKAQTVSCRRSWSSTGAPGEASTTMPAAVQTTIPSVPVFSG